MYGYLQTQEVINRTHLTEGQIQKAYGEGKEQLQKENYEEAMDQFQKIQGYKDADGLYDRAKSEYAQKIYAEVDERKSQEEYEDALNLLDGIEAYYRGDDKYEKRRTEIKEAYIQYFFEQAEASIAEGEYAEAIQILNRGQNRLGESEAFSVKMEEAYRSYRTNFIEQAQEKQEAEDYDGAIQVLKIAQGVFDDDTEIETLMQKIRKEQVLKELETYDQDEDYMGAIQYLNTAFKNMEEDAELISRQNEYILKYKDELIRQAEETYATEGYLAAVQLLQTGIKVIGEDTELQEKIDHYNDLKPVRLDELKKMSGSGLDYGEGISDYYGNDYEYIVERGVSWSSRVNEGTLEYYIGAEYTRMTGYFFLEGIAEYPQGLEVYGDDNLLYSSEISEKDQPQYFEIDLNGVEWLKIYMEGFGNQCGELGNVYLYKD